MNINEWLECGRIRLSMRQYQQKKQRALNICKQELISHERPYVALSGGKDSVAMAFIVDEAAKAVNKDFCIWTHLSDASFPGTEEICCQVSEITGRKLDLSRFEGSAFDLLNAEQVRAFGKEGVFFSEVRKYAKGKDLAFVGTRAQESKRRKQAAIGHGQVFQSASMGGVTVVNPLQWFDLYDVAAAIIEYKAPVHPIYYKTPVDTGNNANGEPLFIRLSYLTSKDLWNKGTAYFIKVNYPELFNKLLQHCPEITQYV